MLTTKVVVRLMDDTHTLLGWAVVDAEARGDGCLWAPQTVVVPFDLDGRATVLSLHLADFHIEHRTSIAIDAVRGRSVSLEQPLLKLGDVPKHLPGVSTRSPAAIVIPTGTLGARPL
jgi:hypothetical protein